VSNYLDTTNQRYPAPGDKVKVVQKKNYASGELTEGVVKDVLTKSRQHRRGHKVRLESGIIGRVQEFVDTPIQPPKLDTQPKPKPTSSEPIAPPVQTDFDEEYDLR